MKKKERLGRVLFKCQPWSVVKKQILKAVPMQTMIWSFLYKSKVEKGFLTRIIPDDHGLVHLHLGDDSGQDASTDGNLKLSTDLEPISYS